MSYYTYFVFVPINNTAPSDTNKWTGICHQIGKGGPQKDQILNTYNSPDRTKGDYSKTKQ